MTRWKSFTVEARREAVDALSYFFTTHGALGMAYDEQRFGPDGDPADPLPAPKDPTKLTAYFPWEADLHTVKKEFLDFLPVLADSFGTATGAFVEATEITDCGWAETWKEHFKPSRLGRRITVKPSWETYAASPDEVVLTIDPGQAFGTGTHETTRMCLRLIEDVFDGADPPRTVLDGGTGTGILGIAAAMLGAGRVLGIDVDPKAVETAAQNARINGVGARFESAVTPLGRLTGTYDLVAANVLAEILADLKAEIGARCAPAGALILSGILTEKADWVTQEYAESGWRLAGRRDDGQWSALLLRRGNPAA